MAPAEAAAYASVLASCPAPSQVDKSPVFHASGEDGAIPVNAEASGNSHGP